MDETAMAERLAELKAGASGPPPPGREIDSTPPKAPWGTAGDLGAEPSTSTGRSLSSVADDLIEAIVNTAGRYQLGLREIDWMTRGVGPGELMFLTGRSYSGKTNVFVNSIFHNLTRRIMVVTMDEPAEHILSKLYSIATRQDFEEVERLVKSQDAETIARLKQVGTDLPNVLVFDDVWSFGALDTALHQARNYFEGEYPEVVFIDYLGLLTGDGDDAFAGTENKARALKRWAQGHHLPVICVHQGTRGNAGKGQKLGMEAMAYGGENEAFHVIGVRRLRDDESLNPDEREFHQDTVSVSVIKSKRLPMRRGEYTFYLDPLSGRITERPEEVPVSTAPAGSNRELFDRAGF